MLINLSKYNLRPTGVIHCGAHYGQEFPKYIEMGIKEKDITFIEAHPGTFQELINRLGHTKCKMYNVALGSMIGRAKMYCSKQNQGQSNSLLKPKVHLRQHPDIKFTETLEIDVVPLDFVATSIANLLVMDCQGMEGEILQGATETLKKIDYVYTEVNRDEVYQGNMQIEDIDKLLHEFTRVETKWMGAWGDAVYFRNHK